MSVVKIKGSQQISISLLILLALFTALDALAIDIYLPAFPILAESLNIYPNQVQQTLSIFLIGLAIGQVFYGPLLDRYGRKLPLLFGTGVFIIGSLCAAQAESLQQLLIARFLQALGAAAGLVAPRAIVSDLCNEQDIAKNLSILVQVMMIMPILAPIFGSYLLVLGSWHLIFYALAVIATVVLMFSFYKLPETLSKDNRQPLAVQSIFKNYWALCSHSPFLIYTIASGLLLGGFFTYISNAPYIFIQYYQINEVYFSYLFAANAVGFILFGQVSIFLLKKISAEHIFRLGVIIFTFFSGLLSLNVYLFELNIWQYALLLGLVIGSTSFMFGTLNAMIMQHSDPQLAGSASSLMGSLQYFIGATIGFIISFFTADIKILPVVLFVIGFLMFISYLVAKTRSSS